MHKAIDELVLEKNQLEVLLWIFNKIPKDKIDRYPFIGLKIYKEDYFEIEVNEENNFKLIIDELSKIEFNINVHNSGERDFLEPLIKNNGSTISIIPQYIETVLINNGILKDIN